ncbi:MAG TPA: hypothetical protein VKC60_15965 [Opitutaceae bacterium]|nr:hypothetical protein [Opitutaceae bacterium]
MTLITKTFLRGFSLLSVCLALVTGCTSITLIAPYDEETNRALTELHKCTERFFVKVEREYANLDHPDLPTALHSTYKTHTEFYDDARVSLLMLELRSKALTHNKITQQEITALENEFAAFEQRDKAAGGLTLGDVRAERAILGAHFRALITLEIAKKSTGGGSEHSEDK